MSTLLEETVENGWDLFLAAELVVKCCLLACHEIILGYKLTPVLITVTETI